MPKTRAELVNRALSNLGALPAGQTANTEEYNQVDALVEPVLESLQARDIYHVSDVSAIPDESFIALGHCLAWACSPEFGLHNDTSMFTLGQQAEIQLKVIQSENPTYKVAEIQAW
jgi:hypothetical protein